MNMKLKKKDKFVTLHIRQLGWRGENLRNSSSLHRTPNSANYIEAIKFLTNKGIKVILVGNNKFSFPKIKNFINYSNSKFRSDFMDVYLAAKSIFCIANTSGYFCVAKYFGTPVLLADGPEHSDYLTLTTRDMYLPRLFKKRDGKVIPLRDCFKYPLNSIYHTKKFEELSIDVIENNSRDIKEAVREMLYKPRRKPLTKLQKKFVINFNKNSTIYGSNFKLKAFANIPDFFLKQNYKLI